MTTITCPDCGSSSSVQIGPAEGHPIDAPLSRWRARCDDCGRAWEFEDGVAGDGSAASRSVPERSVSRGR